MAAEQPCLPTLHHGIGIGKICLARPARLDFRADQNEARLIRFLDVVVVTRFAVLSDQLRRGTVGFRIHQRCLALSTARRQNNPLEDLHSARSLCSAPGVDCDIGLDSPAVDVAPAGS